MPLDPDIDALIRSLPPGPRVEEQTPAEARATFRQVRRALAGAPPPVEAVDALTLPGPAGDLAARIYVPDGAAGRLTPGLVFFHGGGWVIGDLDTHDEVCRALCGATGARVVAVDYRLAPEHRFPAAVEDAVAAVAHVAAHGATLGIDPSRLGVGGDSAGGNLAAVAALHARDHGPALRLQLLIYPATDTRFDTASYEANATGYMLERSTMRWFFDQYAPDAATRADPRLAPLRAADHARLAPAVVAVAGYDPLRDDGVAYAEALRRAGNEVQLLEYPTLVHGFVVAGSVSRAAAQAIEAIGAAVKAALH